ncbi:MAG TPA: hypothetical protein VMH04_19240 [Candidatus Solibacter sp.]|nr:hypothetical protein [Candidatus Solibacter sp.]
MSEMIGWIAAEAERRDGGEEIQRRGSGPSDEELRELEAHSFPARIAGAAESKALTTERTEEHNGEPDVSGDGAGGAVLPGSVEYQAALIEEYREADAEYNNRERRIYRARTIALLRKYMKYAIECGRLPSLLGREFFRTQVTSHTVVTFEDRVIFVHDMEMCLKKLDEFSQQLIARHILQEHDCWETAKLLHCNERTVRRLTPMALDLMTEALLDAGLMDRLDLNSENSCQGGFEEQNSVSDCEEGK